MITRIWNRYRFLILISLLFFFLRLPSLLEPYWYGDEGIYLVLGQGIRQGLTIYRHLHDNKPPTLYYLAAIGQTVFGFRLLLLLWMIPTVYVFWKLVRQFFTIKLSKISLLIFVVLSSVPLIEGSIANAEIFMLLPTLLAVYLIYTRPNLRNLFISGLLLGFAFTIKVPVAAEFAFLALWLIFFSSRFSLKNFKKYFLNLFIFGLGFTIPVLAWGIYFALKGALPEYIFAALLQNFGYLSSWSTGSHSGSATQSGLTSRLLILIFFWLVLYFFKIKRLLPVSIIFVLLWFSSALFGALLSTRPYPHYLIQILPSLILILILIFKRLPIYLRSILVLTLIFFIGILIKYKFYYYPVFRYYSNFYSYVLNLKSSDSYYRYFGQNVPSYYRISEYLKNNSSPSDRIFIWGDDPYIYSLSDRLPSGKFTVAYHVIDFKGYSQVIDAFKINTPRLIVYNQSDRSFPELDNFIQKYYYLAQVFGSTLVFKLR